VRKEGNSCNKSPLTKPPVFVAHTKGTGSKSPCLFLSLYKPVGLIFPPAKCFDRVVTRQVAPHRGDRNIAVVNRFKIRAPLGTKTFSHLAYPIIRLFSRTYGRPLPAARAVCAHHVLFYE